MYTPIPKFHPEGGAVQFLSESAQSDKESYMLHTHPAHTTSFADSLRRKQEHLFHI